jgi:hypothetical protein
VLVSRDGASLAAGALEELAARGTRGAFDKLQDAARADDAGVRREAIRALGRLAAADQLPKLLDLLAKPKESRDRSAVEQAIAAAFRRIEDHTKRAAPLLTALPKAPVAARPAIIRLLEKAPTDKALAAVRKSLADENAAVRDAAVRTLAQWPNAEPAEDLLKLAQTAPDRTHKVLALRGYVRMAGMSKNPTKMYVRAMKLAERPEDKKLVLGGLGTAESVEALDLVEQYLDDAALRSEAAAAAIQIADKVRSKDQARARAAIQKVLAAVDDPGLRKRAGDVISEMEKYEGYIRTWLIAGPYKEKGKDAGQLFGTAFPPEKPESKDVKWKPLKRGIGSWDINLDSALGDESTAAAYLRTRIHSPKEQKARLELSSDDAIKAWLNGKEVHANNTRRGISPAQDAVEVTLQKGWNELLLKAVEYGGGWGAAARIRDVDGTAMEGLKFEAKAD